MQNKEISQCLSAEINAIYYIISIPCYLRFPHLRCILWQIIAQSSTYIHSFYWTSWSKMHQGHLLLLFCQTQSASALITAEQDLGRAVNGGVQSPPFISTIDRSDWNCYLLDKLKFVALIITPKAPTDKYKSGGHSLKHPPTILLPCPSAKLPLCVPLLLLLFLPAFCIFHGPFHFLWAKSPLYPLIVGGCPP